MLNLSQLARESPNYTSLPLTKRFRYFFDPDIYLAENLADFKENAPKLDFPLYKRFPDSEKRAYIIFKNVGLTKFFSNGTELPPNCFFLHDYSGKEFAYWNKNHEFYPALVSFDEVQEKEGLKEEDWVYAVYIKYLIQSNLSIIVDVKKHNFSNKNPEKAPLIEKINSYLPKFWPELQPAF